MSPFASIRCYKEDKIIYYQEMHMTTKLKKPSLKLIKLRIVIELEEINSHYNDRIFLCPFLFKFLKDLLYFYYYFNLFIEWRSGLPHQG